MLKICHVATGFPLSFQGGITNYVRTLASYQKEMGNEVWVLAGPDETVFSFKVHFYKSSKIVPMKIRKPEDKEGLLAIKQFFDEEKFDLIHIHMMLDVDWDFYQIVEPYTYVVSLHDYYFICPRIQMLQFDNTLCASYEEKKCSTCISWFNTIRAFNGLEYKISHNTPFKRFRLPVIPQKMTSERYWRFKRLLENAKMLLPVSSRVQEIYEESGIQGRYQVLHIGNITADSFKDNYIFDWKKDKIDIAMLGTLSYLKGGDLFVTIAEKLNKNHVNVHFYGRSASYKDKIKAVGIIDHGPYKQEDLQEILDNTDLGLVLSVWEDNGPQVVMEFLNTHVPVIGTRLGGIPDFVEDGVNGVLFNPYSEEEVSELVRKIDNMTRDDLYHLVCGIKRTTNTLEHNLDIDQVYQDVLGGNAY